VVVDNCALAFLAHLSAAMRGSLQSEQM